MRVHSWQWSIPITGSKLTAPWYIKPLNGPFNNTRRSLARVNPVSIGFITLLVCSVILIDCSSRPKPLRSGTGSEVKRSGIHTSLPYSQVKPIGSRYLYERTTKRSLLQQNYKRSLTPHKTQRDKKRPEKCRRIVLERHENCILPD